MGFTDIFFSQEEENLGSNQEFEGENSDITSNSSISMEIKVYPNPVLDKLNISFAKDFSNAKMQIVDALGKILISRNLYQSIYQVDFSNFKPGIYFVKILVDGHQEVFKVVK